jgi:hypothetical protein
MRKGTIQEGSLWGFGKINHNLGKDVFGGRKIYAF